MGASIVTTEFIWMMRSRLPRICESAVGVLTWPCGLGRGQEPAGNAGLVETSGVGRLRPRCAC